MVLLDALGRRWTMRVLWELRGGALTFRALQAACGGVSPSVLALRLAELADLGLVAPGYVLTDDGRELGEQLVSLDAWAQRWARRRAGTGRSPRS